MLFQVYEIQDVITRVVRFILGSARFMRFKNMIS